jgi:hypothetical protein
VNIEFTRGFTFENSHNFMNIEPLSRVSIEFRHETAKLRKLAPVESLDSISVDQATIFVCEESLHGHMLFVLVEETSCFVSLLETTWVILISELECSLKFKWNEVVLFNAERSWEAASTVKFTSCKE